MEYKNILADLALSQSVTYNEALVEINKKILQVDPELKNSIYAEIIHIIKKANIMY